MLRTLHNYKTKCYVHRFSLLLTQASGYIYPGGDFLMSGIWVCATDQGRFFTSKNPEQAPNFEVLLQSRPYVLKFYSRTGSFFTILSQTPGSNVKIPVAFSFCFLQPDVFTFVPLYLNKCFKLSITGISLS